MNARIPVLAAIAALMSGVWGLSSAQANVYPSGFSLNTTTFGDVCGTVRLDYILNEDANGGANDVPGVVIEVLNEANAVVRTETIPQQKRGKHSFFWDGRNNSGALQPNGAYRIRVTATDLGYTAWTQLSDNNETNMKYFSPKGVDVNRNPTSPYYGRVYISESLGGTTGGRTTTDGIYTINADRSDAVDVNGNPLHPGDVARGTPAGFLPAATDTISVSPWKLTVGPDDNVYVVDYSDGHSGLFRFNGDLDDASFVEVLDSSGRDATGLNGTHGSISSVIVEGVGETLSVVTLDEDFDGPFPGGFMLRYNLGNNPLPFVGITNREADLETEVVNSIVDAVRGSNGKYYWVQYRLASGAPNMMVFTASPATNDTDQPGAEDIEFNITGALGYNAIALDEARDRLAIATRGTGVGIVIRKYSDPATVVTTVPVPGSTQNRDVAFDAAGNIYVVNNGIERLFVFSPPDGENSMSTTSGPIALSKSAGGPTITAHPEDVSAAVMAGGSSVGFDVMATGTNLTYQWFRDGVALVDNGTTITGATTASLDLSGITQVDDGSTYFVRVCDDSGVAVSRLVTLSVGVRITQQPAGKTVCIGTNDMLTVLAQGSGTLSYQWQRFENSEWLNVIESAIVTGAATDTLSFTGITESEAGQYRVLVTSSGDEVGTPPTNSAAATIVVSDGPTQSAHSGDKTVNAGGAATYQTTFVGKGAVYYRWYKSIGGVETLLFEGPGLDFITYSNIPCSDNGAEIFARGTDDCGTSEGSPRAKIFVNNPDPLPEVCDNGLDDDCNGLTDCADPVCLPNCCNTPFADAEGNGTGLGAGDSDVDQADFAMFQLCFRGPGAGVPEEPAYCHCFDRENGGAGDGDVDLDDLTIFLNCVSGPEIPWVATPGCP